MTKWTVVALVLLFCLFSLFQIKSQKAGTMSFFLKFPHTSSTTVQRCMRFYNKKQ